jgi:DNA-binding NarL/FixJ family response regulator
MKILLVEDHALFREGFRLLLQQINPQAEILEAPDAHSAFTCAGEHEELALVLLDLGLPDMPGLDAISEFRERFPACPVVVLSGSDDRDTVMASLDRGAMGFIPKASNSQLLMGALQVVFANGVYIPPSVLARPAGSANAAHTAAPAACARAGGSTPSDLGLTERQIEVLKLVVQGQSNKLIARKLDLAEATVKAHVTAVLRALKVTTRTQAVLAVGELGWSLK